MDLVSGILIGLGVALISEKAALEKLWGPKKGIADATI